jgi:outer membrane protein TolC
VGRLNNWRGWFVGGGLAIVISMSTHAIPTTTILNKDAYRLQKAISNPEYMLDNWVELPLAPIASGKKPQRLSLREAILLALRYNANIQNSELDRIIQRYQLRLANNEFELQYALAGSAAIEKSRYSGIGSVANHMFLATPEINLKTKYGTQLALGLTNNVSNYNDYSPVLNVSVTQPLLRGFGADVNQANLLNANDTDRLNKINLRQAIIDQVTQVISAYRALILSSNNLQNQRRQLTEAQKSFEINQKKIEAGQLEPTGNIQQSYQIESLNLMVEQAENEFNTTSLDLLQSIGLDPGTRLSVPSDVVVGTIRIPNLSQACKTALKNNSQYLAQQINLRADKRAYEVATNQQRWQLDISANMQTGSTTDVEGSRGIQGIYNGRNTSQSAQLQLTIPIRDINRKSQLINAKVQLEKDRLTLITTKRALITTVTNTVNTIQSQAKRYLLAERQVKLANQSYDLEKKKQQAGIASALDVNNTQNQLIQAQTGLISAKIAYLNQLSALERLLGTTIDVWQLKLRYGQ